MADPLVSAFSEQLDRLVLHVDAAPRHVAVAVSGGPDSVALALLADGWVKLRSITLTCLIVDHGLRDGSAEEAKLVQSRLHTLGLSAHILQLPTPLPADAGQSAARDARYSALTAAMDELQANVVLMGHHLDDQIETVRMRASRDSGSDGLAGISAVRRVQQAHGSKPELLVLRPLLKHRKAELVAWLEAQSVPYVTDPANSNPRFERSQLRAEPLSPKAEALLLATMRQAAALRRSADQELSRQLGRVEFGREGWAKLPWGLLTPDRIPATGAEHAREQAARLIRHLCQYLSATPRPPRRKRALRVVEQLQALGTGAQATLGGMVLQRGKTSLTLARETRKWADRMILPRGQDVSFDRRFAVQASPAMPAGLTLGLTGRKGWPLIRDTLDPANPALVLKAPVLFSLPCLFDRCGQPVALAFDRPDWLSIHHISSVPRIPRGFVGCLPDESPYLAG